MTTPSSSSPQRRLAAWSIAGLVSVTCCVVYATLANRRLAAPDRREAAPAASTRNFEAEAVPPFTSANPATIDVDAAGLRTEATAVDPQLFHIVIGDSGAASGPPSPFIVAATTWSSAKITHAASENSIQTPAGQLTLTSAGVLTLQNPRGRDLLWRGAVRRNKAALELSFQHAPGRFYGGGNAGLGRAGGLIQTRGVSEVDNGVTRIPFLWSPSGFGILIANNMQGIGWSDKAGVLRCTVPAKYIDLYLIAAPNPYAILDAYSRLTGRPPVPPAWTFGYLQSRWGYANAADVREKWYRFQALHIPVDAFIYDYDWFTDDWRFNPKTFPDPAGNLAEMHRLGLHFVGIRKPRVHGRNLRYAQSRGWTMIGADLRFDLPDVQKWWAANHAPLLQDGVDGWWNDEAENSYDEFFFMNVAERDGWDAAAGKPFWSLNRAFAPGMQRFGAAVWTGDIPTSWESLQNQPGTLLNWSMCGMPYVGQDIGGFTGTPSPELYARWMQEGALTPIMRAHGAQNLPRWPWAFGGKALDAARKAIVMRRRLRPYLLSCAREASRTGAPIMRPLFFEFPNDPVTYNMEREWLLGRDLLAAPVLNPGGRDSVYLPRGVWRDINTKRLVTGPRWIRGVVPLDTIPMYARVPATQGGQSIGL